MTKKTDISKENRESVFFGGKFNDLSGFLQFNLIIKIVLKV